MVLDNIKDKLLAANNSQELQLLRVEIFGKQGLFAQEMRKLSTIQDQVEKIEFGKNINDIKVKAQLLFDEKLRNIEILEEEESFAKEKLDMTIPARPRIGSGSIHPITQVTAELAAIFSSFGFTIQDGPNIDNDWYNFTALNIPAHHPARQMQDTFYLQGQDRLLRTHTSTIQMRTMENKSPPYRFIAPGRVYRADSDMTHTPMFHQIEGVAIDKSINMGNLKYLIREFIQRFFESTQVELRFRPSFFPFTEPSAEVDIRLPGNSNWLEVMGCGMTHPNVLRNANIDPDIYQGFAFGLGIDRFAMLKYGVDDLRQFFQGDARWLKHYNFSPIDLPQ